MTHTHGEQPDLAYAGERLWRTAFPNVAITAPAEGILFERDVPILVRDGTTLRANVFRPAREGRFPVLASAHPYGKDVLPKKTPFGYLPLARYRFIRQPDPVTFSAYTSWEAPDPGYWVPRGYVVINVDLRGFGSSGGIGTLFSDQEAADYAEVIEWAGAQPWSTGRVGLFGVSYLAISQWKVAALRPKSLAAICPWEGWTDFYRDVAFPGGVREDGFVPFWANMTERAGRTATSLRKEQLARPLIDDFWSEMAPNLERIQVPALICASFSDQGLHTRGSFEAFRRIQSEQRFLYTHRGGKWSTFYSPEAVAVQSRFFDCFLKGHDNGMRESKPVRLEVRTGANTIHEVREERTWPPSSTRWTKIHLGSGVLSESPVAEADTVHFEASRGRASFRMRVSEDLEIVGPMKLRLFVEMIGATDAHLFVTVRKLVGDAHVLFEGPFGFGYDVVTRGWLRLGLRRLDEQRSEPHRPVRSYDRVEPFLAGRVEPVDIELLPSATRFHAGEALRLDVQGRWFWRRNPLFGMFPGDYSSSTGGTVVLHIGGPHDAHLLVPRAGE
jgi:predicted acyl esterase